MIEGLKVTVKGDELRQLCRSRATYHQERVAAYATQIASMESAKVEGMNYTNGDPIGAMKDKQKHHQSEFDELLFIADHLKLMEEYLLDSQALQKLGICKSRY